MTHAELRRFKEQHGHIVVPRVEEYKTLYKFLDNQGQSYRRLIEGKKSTLTVRRIKDLDEVRIQHNTLRCIDRYT